MNPRRPSPEDLKSMKNLWITQPFFVIDYQAVKEDFLSWLGNRELNQENYVRQLVRYLEKFAKPINQPMDVVTLFNGLSNSTQKRHLTNGLRNLFKFYESQGLASTGYLDLLRKNLPRVSVGIDLKVPELVDIIRSLKHLEGSGRFFALYNMLLDSGLRLTEGIRLYNSLLRGEVEGEKYQGFYVVPLGYFRGGTKLAYYGFITETSLELVKSQKKPLTYKKVMGVLTKRFEGVVSWKYLRKFVNDIMTSEELNIPESVADFIEGRVPRTIGARHYMMLRRKAIGFYPRYVEYLARLRKNQSID